MVSADRIAEKVTQIRQQIDADQVRWSAEHEKWRVKSDAREKIELAQFEAQLPALRQRAIEEHDSRFEPLQNLLDPLTGPLVAMRDNFLPGSRIIVADGYANLFKKGTPNRYHRAVIMFYADYRHALSVHAIGEEPGGKIFKFFGPDNPPKLSLLIRQNYNIRIGSLYRDWRPFIDRAKKQTEDFHQVMKEEEIFDRWFYGAFFSSRYAAYTASPLYVAGPHESRHEWIPFNGSRTYKTVENKLAENLTSLAS